MQAFLSAYHGEEQSSESPRRPKLGSIRARSRRSLTFFTPPLTFSDLIAGDLTGLQTGVIWTALCVDYPGHSFSHLGLYFGSFEFNCREKITSCGS